MVLVNGKHEREFGIVQEMGHTNPATPNFANHYEDIPGKVGSYDFGTKIGPKPLSIPYLILDCSIEEAQERVDNYVALFFDDLAKPKEVEVVFDYDRMRFYKAKVESVDGPHRVNNRTSRFSVNLIAADPYRYSRVFNDEILWGSEILTFESTTYTLGHENPESRYLIKESGAIKIHVLGLALQPQISIWGKATNLVITNQGKQIYVGTFANKRIEIDCEKYIAYEAGAEKLIMMDKFFLRTGLNNVQFSGSNIDIDVTIKIRDRWK